MTVEDPRHMLAAGQVTEGVTDDRWLAASYRCSCGFASDGAGEFGRHLDAADGTGPEHFEVLAGWTFDQVEPSPRQPAAEDFIEPRNPRCREILSRWLSGLHRTRRADISSGYHSLLRKTGI